MLTPRNKKNTNLNFTSSLNLADYNNYAKDQSGFSDILNVLDEIIIVIDHNFEIILANNAAREISNMDISKCIRGKKCYEVLYQRSSICLFCPLADLMETKKDANSSQVSANTNNQLNPENDISKGNWSYEHEHHHQGTIFSSRWMLSNNERSDFPVIEVIRDITKIKKELQKKNHNIKLSLIGQMVSSIIHNLNNPLTGMGLTISLMKRDLKTVFAETLNGNSTKEYPGDRIKSIFKSIKMLESDLRVSNEIMMDLMNYSRPSPIIKLDKNIWLSMLKAIRNIKTHYPDLLKHSNIILIGKRRIINVAHAPERIARVFINIITNSLQAVKGVQNGFVKIYLWQSRKSVIIIISDNGTGIPQDIQHLIFDPFFTTRRLSQGGGLGLSLSDELVREHGGKILLKSRKGHTSFFIIFPKI